MITDVEPFTKALERMNRFQEPEARALIADLGLAQGSRGLDVGCGVGLFALWLAEAIGPGGSVIGIEPSAERPETARALVGHALPAGRLDFRQGDATALDFGDASFDWVWCGDVLHHVQETGRAIAEFARVLRPGGRLIVKESQLLAGLFLPGHPALERRLRQAEMEWSLHEGGEFSFEERRQRTLASLRAAGLRVDGFRTYLLERRAPLPEAARDYIQRVVFERNWGPRLRDLLTPADWAQRSALCDAGSASFVLNDPDYYCLYPISVLVGYLHGGPEMAPKPIIDMGGPDMAPKPPNVRITPAKPGRSSGPRRVPASDMRAPTSSPSPPHSAHPGPAGARLDNST